MFRPRSVATATTEISDDELMRLYRGGNENSFRTLYERHRAALLRFVRRTVLDPADVDEVVQETWMCVIRGKERYLADGRFVAWLFSIARRRGLDCWRRRGRRPDTEECSDLEELAAPEGTQPDSQITSEALASAIMAALATLPFLQREVFLLRAETDLTLDEIAQVTGTTRETAKSRLRYGITRLRAAMEPWSHGSD
jgi:RNA polymerase sigma-70 factor (ECF subfamily)